PGRRVPGGGHVSPTLTLATAGRVLGQLRRGPRTIALVVVMPCVLLWLFKEVFAGGPLVFQAVRRGLVGPGPVVGCVAVSIGVSGSRAVAWRVAGSRACSACRPWCGRRGCCPLRSRAPVGWPGGWKRSAGSCRCGTAWKG